MTERILKIFDALSDETRLKVFLLLVSGDLCVCELVDILRMKQPRMSHIMRKLSEAGLVKTTRDGKWRIYSASKEALKLGIVKSLTDDIKISANDLRKLRQCKKNDIRGTCKQ